MCKQTRKSALPCRAVPFLLKDAMDDAGEAPENMEALKNAVMEKLSEWYMRNHGVGTMANVEDMCTLLQVFSLVFCLVLPALLKCTSMVVLVPLWYDNAAVVVGAGAVFLLSLVFIRNKKNRRRCAQHRAAP